MKEKCIIFKILFDFWFNFYHISILVPSLVNVEPDLPLVQQRHDLVLITDGRLLNQTTSNVEPDPIGQLERSRIVVRMIKGLVGGCKDGEGTFVTNNLDHQKEVLFFIIRNFLVTEPILFYFNTQVARKHDLTAWFFWPIDLLHQQFCRPRVTNADVKTKDATNLTVMFVFITVQKKNP